MSTRKYFVYRNLIAVRELYYSLIFLELKKNRSVKNAGIKSNNKMKELATKNI